MNPLVSVITLRHFVRIEIALVWSGMDQNLFFVLLLDDKRVLKGAD